MRLLVLITLLPAALATPVLAQAPNPHAGHRAAAPAQPAADPHAAHRAAPPAAAVDPHAGHAMPASPPAPSPPDPHAGHSGAPPSAAATDPHAGHVMPGMTAGGMTGADQPVGSAPPPPAPPDNAADRVFDLGAMNRARGVILAEHGATRVSKVMGNFLEYKSEPEGGYRWDVEAWYGGDINRFVLKTEGDGGRRDGVEAAEVQALYSRAVARYTDVQFGVRQDFEPSRRTYATVGVESLFPYWFEAEAALFLSDKGDLLGRLEGTYDLRLAQRLVLQPQAELGVSAQDIRRTGTGSGFTHAELGLRLRYEIRREFAPYVGVAYERSLGRTADFARAAGEDVESTSFVVGLRAWF